MSGIDRDILITRVLDGEATPEDWAAFRALAERDPAVWRELVDAQQDRAEISTALAEAISVADAVEAPIGVVAGERLSVRFRTAGAWLGWAAAATLAVGAFLNRTPAPEPALNDATSQANLFPISSPADALKLYMDSGQRAGSVLGEMPERLLVSTRPSPDGGYEVVFLRQILERQRIEDFYRLGKDEAGRSVPVPCTPTQTRRATY